MATTQYIGSRYVPLFADPAEWNNTRAYEPLTIVLHDGNSYTSKQYVPVGVDIANSDYWAETGNYNAQVEQYRKEVLSYDERITTADTVAGNALSMAQKSAQDVQQLQSDLSTIQAPSVGGEFYNSFFIPVYNDTRDSSARIDEEFEKLLKMKCKAVLIVHINEQAVDGTGEGMNNIEYFMGKIKENNVTCDVVKFHCTNIGSGTTFEFYKKMVEKYLSTYTFNTCWLFNEDLDSAEQHLDFLAELKSKYATRFGTSLSFAGYEAVVTKGSKFVDACDIIGYNFYPAVCYGNKPTPGDYDNAFKSFFLYTGSKELVITECGIKPLVSSLPSPATWNNTGVVYNQIQQQYMRAAIMNLLPSTTVYDWFSNHYTPETAAFIGGLVSQNYK